MRLAGAAVAESNNIVVGDDIFTTGQFENERLVERPRKGSSTVSPGWLNEATHHFITSRAFCVGCPTRRSLLARIGPCQRLLNTCESHVVEAASIAVPRRHRHAKTDTIDGELLLRTLMAFKRGEPRVCAMVVVPTPEEEDRRQLSRERKTMVKERIEHINRIKGLMACQGIVGSNQGPPRRENASTSSGPETDGPFQGA